MIVYIFNAWFILSYNNVTSACVTSYIILHGISTFFTLNYNYWYQYHLQAIRISYRLYLISIIKIKDRVVEWNTGMDIQKVKLPMHGHILWS